MKRIATVLLAALLSACSAPHFVGDAPPVPVTTRAPDHFELPARFALARVVYGRLQAAGTKEAALWEELVTQRETLGSFTPLIADEASGWRHSEATMIETARQQRYNYLLLVRMDPGLGSADISLFHVGSGGVMATTQALAPGGGQNGFWGNAINNPARLERVTLRIAEAAIPAVEELLQGIVERQR